MVAYRFIPGNKQPQREVVPVPTPNPNEVLVKVLAAGVCHSDLHLLDWSDTRPFAPQAHTLGHEGAGIVVQLGSALAADPSSARRLAAGTYVAVLTTNPCEQPDCDACSRGYENVCWTWPMVGLGIDGCWAEYVAASASTVVPVPGNNPKDPRLSPGVVAVATDAVLTPWHALTRAAGLRKGQTVLILGCGGLGSNAIQIAKHALGAAVVVGSDVRLKSLELARSVGADYAVLPGELRALLAEKKLTVDVVMDLVGKQPTVDAAMELVRIGGTVLLVGLGADAVGISPLATTTRQLTVKGSFGGNCQSLAECLQMIAEGKIKPEVEGRPLYECVDVVQALAEGKIRSRVALIP
ncbi:alcohol dehydogenase [Trametes elegans]|nr:alcohol dehydogenase [Trametes elegans]